jgi:Protein of unknown function (DUF3048) N-terminal domain/Protein of unknown function (DUF3048) C-terminal domain
MSALDRLRQLLGRPHRHVVVLGAAALLVVVSIVSVVVTRGSHASVEQTTTTTVATTTTTTAPTTTTTTAPRSVAPLTGMEGNFQGRIRRPALFVKIDNVSEARPQSGLNQADIVFEEAVEGDVSRLAAVFHSTDSSGVGPVRSVRTTDLELLGLFGRVLFASSGGNGGVVPQLHNTNAVDVGDNVSHQGFFRAGGRPAPHNLFSSTLELYGKAPESPPPPRRVFSYLRRGERLPAGAIPVGGIALRFGGPEISRFTWDAASGTWLRTQSGTPHLDASGVQVAPENVVVAEVDYDRSGQRGRSVPHGIVSGRGRVVVLTRGKAIRGTWVRPTLAHRLRLVADSGAEIKLTPGQTFVELPERGGWNFV